MTCEHKNLLARGTICESPTDATDLRAQFQVRCGDCLERFVFVGLDPLYTEDDALKTLIPVRPQSQRQ